MCERYSASSSNGARQMSSDDGFPIAVIARAKNGILWAAVKKAGSQSKLARLLGLSPSDLGGIINMTAVPRNFASKKWKDSESRLMQICGLTWDEVVPVEMRSRDFLDMPKQVEREQRVPLARLSSYGRHCLLPSPHDALAQEDVQEVLATRINDALDRLSHRQREIVKLRFGLTDGTSYTLEEVARIFRVTRERVRQIEAKAIRILQQPQNSGELIGVLDDVEN